MNVHANPLSTNNADMSLGTVLTALTGHDEKALVMTYDGQRIGAGYHVTEVKAGSFVTLDCGGNPDAWQETILQVEDLPAPEGQRFMTVGKFRSILSKVSAKVALDHGARLTIEVGPPGTAMRVYDVAAILISEDQTTLELGSRPAICKPRHRAERADVTPCCGPSAGSNSGRCCG